MALAAFRLMMRVVVLGAIVLVGSTIVHNVTDALTMALYGRAPVLTATR